MKRKIPPNYLLQIPQRRESLAWERRADGVVIVMVENTGWANRIAQLVFHRPKVTCVELDPVGSFLWPMLDGQRDLTALGRLVEEKFGAAAHPLYERLAQYFQTLEGCRFVIFKEKTRTRPF